MELVTAKNDLEGYIFSIRSILNSPDKVEFVSQEEVQNLKELTDETLDWLDDLSNKAKFNYVCDLLNVSSFAAKT